MNTVKIEKHNTKMIAHRGLSGIETENTASAFVASANRSYFGIETDVHVTNDGKFIIIHDDDTKRVSDSDFAVEKTDFDMLRHIRLHNSNGTANRADLIMPTPEDYFDICKKYGKTAIFELKNDMESHDIERLVALIDEYEMLESTIFISFSLDNLIKLKQINPNLSAQYLISEINDVDNLIKTLKKYSIHLDSYHGALNKDIINQMHSNGILVNAWTVNDPNRAAELVKMGIDFITTNILE